MWVVSERPAIRGDGQSRLVSRFITRAPIKLRCAKTPPSHRERGTGDEGATAIRFKLDFGPIESPENWTLSAKVEVSSL